MVDFNEKSIASIKRALAISSPSMPAPDVVAGSYLFETFIVPQKTELGTATAIRPRNREREIRTAGKA